MTAAAGAGPGNECPHCGAMLVTLKNNQGEPLLCDAEPIMVIGTIGDYRGFKPHTCDPAKWRAKRPEAKPDARVL